MNNLIFYLIIIKYLFFISVSAEETYKNISEEYVINILQNITEETFYSVFSEIKNLIKCQIK